MVFDIPERRENELGDKSREDVTPAFYLNEEAGDDERQRLHREEMARAGRSGKKVKSAPKSRERVEDSSDSESASPNPLQDSDEEMDMDTLQVAPFSEDEGVPSTKASRSEREFSDDDLLGDTGASSTKTSRSGRDFGGDAGSDSDGNLYDGYEEYGGVPSAKKARSGSVFGGDDEDEDDEDIQMDSPPQCESPPLRRRSSSSSPSSSSSSPPLPPMSKKKRARAESMQQPHPDGPKRWKEYASPEKPKQGRPAMDNPPPRLAFRTADSLPLPFDKK
ncbi:hypothetical protein NMY22_g10133 [Coprinellus aureogranulatus]|nr:hypothetical protein NMY22_g10133 [Coprinellus aureogranulatus]